MRSSSATRLAGNVLVVAGVLTWMSTHTATAPEYAPPVVTERPRLALVPPPPERTDPEPRSIPWKRVLNWLGLALAIAAAGFWFTELRPQSLGGPAGYVLVSGKSMWPHYHTGDLVLVSRQSSYHVGQVVAYRVPKGDPMAGAQVIHRIIGGDAKHGFVIQGDNRTAPDVWRPKPADIVGAKVLRIPRAVVVLQYLRSPVFLGILAGSFVFVNMLGKPKRKDEDA